MTSADKNRRLLSSVMLLTVWSIIGTAVDAAPTTEFDVNGDLLSIQRGSQQLDVSLKSPQFQLEDGVVVGNTSPIGMKGDLASGETLEVTYAAIPVSESTSIEAILSLKWSEKESLLRKSASVRLVASPEKSVSLEEVILDRFDAGGRPVATHGPSAKSGKMIFGPSRSHPVFLPGIFLGIEFPAASTRYENGQVVLAHRPGVKLNSEKLYNTRTAIYGLAEPDQEVRAFQKYIASNRPTPQGIHINYNSWWTSHYPGYTEDEILGLMKTWADELFQARGSTLDSFCIDLGWSNKLSVWEINHERFPEEFSRLRDAAQQMQSNIGLWISPSSYYPEGLDGEWAKENGYETQKLPNVRALCLGGPKYSRQFQARVADMVKRYHISHLKFDGITLECPETDHGHAPGADSCEQIAEGMIAAMKAAREANPKIWLEPTCFGSNASPWWLFYANSVTGAFGDDAPAGRVPSPIYRESYTSAKDYFNLQGAYLLPTPINAQELLGIVHQTPDPMTNDAVMSILRGNMFVPLYVNPRFMNATRWDALAALLKWARQNEQVLQNTTPLLPASWQKGDVPQFADGPKMPREPYGYAHVQGRVGLIALRNPWITPQTYSLKIDQAVGFDPATNNLSAVSLYPEPRQYASNLKFGDTIDVVLAPYETLVMSVRDNPPGGDLPAGATAVGTYLKIDRCVSNLQRVNFTKSSRKLGRNWTRQLEEDDAVRLTCNASVRVTAPRAELLILCEGEKSPRAPVGELKINGRTVATESVSSDLAWVATGQALPEHWTFLRAPLEIGDNELALEQYLGTDCKQVSVWVWATKPGGTSSHPNAMPQPETISLDSIELVPPTDVAALPSPTIRVERPVERIKGVFLDAVKPVSVVQGAGTLQHNRAITEKPLVIGGRIFQRGLGTHAPSKIVYSLDGKFERFQSWAGADGNTYPTVKLEVWVDGERKWNSELMTRDSHAAWIDLDVSGAKSLELVVDSDGDSAADHADWAEARLLQWVSPAVHAP